VLPWLSAGAAIAAMLAVTLFPHRDNSKDLMSVRDAALRAATGPQIAADATAPALPGFRLAATRTDIVAGHPAKVLHYTLANQNVTLCVWPAGSEPRHGIRTARYEGMSIDYWNDGTQEYWAITDGPPSALKKFISEYKES
jgi:anti-sigma factor RsiW